MSVSGGQSPFAGDALALILVQLMFIIALSRIYAYLFRWIKQPTVIAEVLAGITLGATLFGRIPNYVNIFFPASSMNTLSVLANLGLIFYLFIIGLELDISLLKTNIKQGFAISISAIIVPFALGSGIAILLFDEYGNSSESGQQRVSFILFIGVAMSITAFPVLARILAEFKLLSQKVGVLAISAAAVDDVVAWCLLALVVSIARASDPLEALYTLILLFAFFLFMLMAVKPLLERFGRAAQKNDTNSYQFLTFIIILVLLCSWTTEVIGVHAIFGGFMLGVITPRNFALKIIERLEDLVVIVFLPAYFAFSGLRTDLGLLNSGSAWGYAVLVIATACVGKFGAATTVSRLLGKSWRESCTVGVLMNTKGLVELVVLNIGLDVGVLSPEVFAIFVLMAVITTMMTSPIVYWIWIRHQKKKAITSTGGIIFCPSNPASGRRLTTLANIFYNATQQENQKPLRGIFTFELSDRPSTFYANRRRATKVKEAPYQIVAQRARELKVKMKTKAFHTSEPARDIVKYAVEHQSAVSLFEWDWGDFWHPGRHYNKDSSQLHAVRKLLQHHTEATQSDEKRDVAILIDKANMIDQMGVITTVAVPIWDLTPFQQADGRLDLRFAKSFNPAVNVILMLDLMSLPQHQKDQLERELAAYSNVSVIARHPTAEVCQSALNDRGAQLMVMFSEGDRREQERRSHLLSGLIHDDSEAATMVVSSVVPVVLVLRERLPTEDSEEGSHGRIVPDTDNVLSEEMVEFDDYRKKDYPV